MQLGRSGDELKATTKRLGAAVRWHLLVPALWLMLLLGNPWVVARAQAPADAEAMARAKREAESPMRWIKLHAESAKKAVPPAPSANRAVSDAKPAKPSAKRAVSDAKPAKPNTAQTATAGLVQEPTSAPEALAASAPVAAAGLPLAQEIVVVDRTDPQWGDALMQSLRKGRVEVSFEVGAEGRLLRSQVVSSSNPRLDSVALEAVRQWNFQPMDKARSATAEFGFDLTREQSSSHEELVLMDQAEPSWDPEVMRTVRQGHVRVRIEVDVDGRLSRVEVASSSDKRLDAAALDAVRRWRFRPLEQRRVATVEVGFDLDRK